MSEKRLSNDKPRIVYSTTSPHSGEINVWKHKGGLVLEVGGYPQSLSLDTPSLPKRYWARATAEVSSRLKDPKRALILGVGGGTILHLLSQKFPNLDLVGVEIDPEIIKVARKFFNLEDIPSLTVVVGDGGDYIRGFEGDKFDLTFVDAYLGSNFPLHFEEKEFLSHLKKITSPSGMVVINRASGFDRSSFEDLLEEVFEEVEEVKIPLPGFLGGMGGNYLFICR